MSDRSRRSYRDLLARASGAEMSDEALVRLVRKIARTPFPTESPLSPNELRCVRAASHGLDNRLIADAFGIGYETVRTTMKYANRKLGAKDRAHAVAIALRRGLIQ